MSTQLPRLKLRTDLQITYQSYGNRPCYLLEDPLNGQFFQIGAVEHSFIQQLDGETDLPAVLAKHPELPPAQAQQLCQWLLQNQLAYAFDEEQQAWQLMPARNLFSQQLSRYFNPLFIRIPLGSPDRLISALFPWLRGLLGMPFFFLWLLICLSGAYHIATQWERFIQAANSLFSVHNLLLLVLAWALTKTIHEIFHGLVCKKYGGHIHQAGILLILFMPLGGYVNASASWRFTSRWQRMHVSAAGMFSDLLWGGVAAWVWAYTDTGLLNYLAYNIVIITTIGTVLFNANPLMRFDGYYVLTDVLNIPNLYTTGMRYMQYLGQRYLLGLAVAEPQYTVGKVWIIKVYGIVAWLWRWLVMLVLLVLATTLFDETGMVLAILALLFTLGIPLGRLMKRLYQHPRRQQVLRRLVILSIGGGGVLLMALTQLYWSPHLQIPAVIAYADATDIRAESPGFIQQFLVQAGDVVQAGQPLVQLDNLDLRLEAKDLALQIEQQLLQQQHYFTTGELSRSQAVGVKVKQLRRQQLDTQQQVEALQIVAPHAGTVIAIDLSVLQGTYVPRGTMLFTLADPQQLEIQLSIPQQHIEALRANLGETVQIYRDTQPLHAITATLDHINPRASQHIKHPALTAIGGGNLSVKPLDTVQAREDELGYSYLQPRFSGTVNLPKDLTQPLYAGETAQVVLVSPQQSLGSWLWVGFWQYVDSIVASTEAL